MTIVKWPGVVELRKVGCKTEVEFPRALGNPSKRRKSRMRVVPINRQPNPSCVGLGFCGDRLQEPSGASDPFQISGQRICSFLIWPTQETNRCSSRVIDMKSVRHMDKGHSKMHRYQLDVR